MASADDLIKKIISALNGIPIVGPSKTITLSPGKFGIDFIDDFFKDIVKADSLSISQAEKKITDNSASIKGTTIILGYVDLDITLDFRVKDDEVVITLDGYLKTSTSLLEGFFPWISLKLLGITVTFHQQFSVGSIVYHVNIDVGKTNPLSVPADISALEEGFWQIGIAEGTEKPIGLDQLVSLMCGFLPSSFFPESFSQVLSGLKINGIGAIFNADIKEVISFSTGIAVTNGWDIAPKISLNPGLQLTFTLINPTNAYTRQFVGIVRGSFAIESVTVPVFVQVSLERGGSAWMIGLDPERDVVRLPSISSLFALAGGDSFKDSLPESLRNVPAIDVSKLEVDFSPAKKNFDLIAFAAKTATPWVVIDGFLTVQSLSFQFELINLNIPEEKKIGCFLHGTFSITDSVWLYFNVDKDAESADWVLSGGLPPGKILNLTDLAGKMLRGFAVIPEEAPTISFDTADILVIPGKSMDFTAGSRSEWALIPGKLSINTFTFNFNYNNLALPPDSKYSGSLDAEFTIAKIPIQLRTKIEASGSWSFDGSTAKGQKIMIGDLISDLLDKFDIAVPTPLKSLSLQDLSIHFVSAGKGKQGFNEFSAGCKGFFSLFNADMDVAIDIDLKRRDPTSITPIYDKDIIGTLVLHLANGSSQTFTIKFFQNLQEEKFTASWKASPGNELSIGGIIETLVSWITDEVFGLATPWDFLNEIRFESLSFEFNLKSKEMTFTIPMQPIDFGIGRIDGFSVTYLPSDMPASYVFSWEDIPGKDDGRLKGFLIWRFDIDWIRSAHIEKIDNDKTIKISTGHNVLYLKLNNIEDKVILEINDVETDRFKATMESGKLNIYPASDMPGRDKGVYVKLDGSFSWEKESSKPLQWDATKPDSAPVPPGGKILDLRLLALGQHVKVEGLAGATKVEAAMGKLKDLPADPDDLMVKIAEGTALSYDPRVSWLVVADFGILRFDESNTAPTPLGERSLAKTGPKSGYLLSLSLIFSDPDLYGLRLALAGPYAKIFAGLALEVMYRKISNTLGVFQTELKLPDAMRSFEVGVFTITLPVLALEVYTNGDFKVDLGFPWNMDFSRSFMIQGVIPPGIPILGAGGLYFGKLSSGTSTQVPRITNGNFNPVIIFGIGLMLGVGKEIDKGIFKAGISIALVGIIEGVIAKWNPNTPALASGNDIQESYYFRLQGTLGIVGKLFGSVDFGIIKASVNVQIALYAQITYESYADIPISVMASVSVSLTLVINLGLFKINLSFEFSITIKETLYIHNPQSGRAPWQVDSGGAKASLSERHAGRLRSLSKVPSAGKITALNWNNYPPLDQTVTPVTLEGYFAPVLTASGLEPCYVTMLFLDNEKKVASTNDNSLELTSFQALCMQVLKWVVAAGLSGNWTEADIDEYTVRDKDEDEDNLISEPTLIEILENYLISGEDGTSPIPMASINAFMTKRFILNLEGLDPDKEYEARGVVFPMPPDLTIEMSPPNKEFLRYKVDKSSLDHLRKFFSELAVQVDKETREELNMARSGRSPEYISMTTFVFEDYFLLLARQMVQIARNALRNFRYPVKENDSIKSILDWIEDNGGNTLAGALTAQDIMEANSEKELKKGITLWMGAEHILSPGDTLASIAQAASMDIIHLASYNADNQDILRSGVLITFKDQDHIINSGDTLTSLTGTLGLAFGQVISAIESVPSGGALKPSGKIYLPATSYRASYRDTLSSLASTFSTNYYGNNAHSGDILQDLVANNAWVEGILKPGEIIETDKKIHTISLKDSLGSLAGFFGYQLNNKNFIDLVKGKALNPLALLMLPIMSYGVSEGQSLESISKTFGISVRTLAQSSHNLAEQGIFFTGENSGIDLPHLNQLKVGSLMQHIQRTGGLSDLSGMASRYMLHGVRLPFRTINDTETSTATGIKITFEINLDKPEEWEWNGLYQLTSQQFSVPNLSTQSEYYFILHKGAGATWVSIPDSGLKTMIKKKGEAQAQEGGYDENIPAVSKIRKAIQEWSDPIIADGEWWSKDIIDANDPQNLGVGPVYKLQPKKYPFPTMAIWQSPENVHLSLSESIDSASGTLADKGLLKIWTIPESLAEVAHRATTPLDVSLYTGTFNEATSKTDEAVVTPYSWGTIINFKVKKVAPVAGYLNPGLTYEVLGANERGIALLENLLCALNKSESSVTDMAILYKSGHPGGGMEGLQSGGLLKQSEGDANKIATFIYQVNLTTVTLPSETQPMRSAAISHQGGTFADLRDGELWDYLRLLWEGSITRSGGYYLYYSLTEDNTGLPDAIFNDKGEAVISLLMTYKSGQIANYMNCAITGDQIDITRSVVFASCSDTASCPETSGLSSRVPVVSPGIIPLEVKRIEPMDGEDGDKYKHYLMKIFSMLSYSVKSSDDFKNCDRFMPIGPIKADDDHKWVYQQALPYAGMALPPIKPEPIKVHKDESTVIIIESPYVALGKTLSLVLVWQDIFGNRIERIRPRDCKLKIGFTDAVMGLSQWPGMACHYGFQRDNDKRYFRIEFDFNAEGYLLEEKKYVFGWGKIPGSDEGRLKEFLMNKFDINWAKTAKIEKISNNKIIKVSDEENSVSLTLNDESTKAILEIDSLRYEFIAEKENDELNIYEINPSDDEIKSAKERAWHDLLAYAQIYYQLLDATLSVETSLNLPNMADLAEKDCNPGISLKNSLLNWIWIDPGSPSIIFYLSECLKLGCILKETSESPLESSQKPPSKPDLSRIMELEFDPASIQHEQPEAIFKLTVDFIIKRDKSKIHPDFQDTNSIEKAITPLSPLRLYYAKQDNPQQEESLNEYSLKDFARSFEEATSIGDIYLKIATGIDRDENDSAALWIVRISNASNPLTDSIKYKVNSPGLPRIFAPRPLFNRPVDLTDVEICDYVPGGDISKEAPRTLNFMGVDVDAWLKVFLNGVEKFLSPEFATSLVILWEKRGEKNETAPLEKLLECKKAIAAGLSKLLVPALGGISSDGLLEAQKIFEEDLLIHLSNFYSTEAAVQLDVSLKAPEKLRLFGPVVPGSEIGKSVSLTSAKMAIKKDMNTLLTFLLQKLEISKGDSSEINNRSVSLSPLYLITNIEHKIGMIPDIEYEASSWLTFVNPSDSLLQIPLGSFEVPLILRALPTPPSMVDQYGSSVRDPSAQNDPSGLNIAIDFDYSLVYSRDYHEPQDEVDFTLVLNKNSGSPTVGCSLQEGIEHKLARFITVYPDIEADLEKRLKEISAKPEDTALINSALNAINVFILYVEEVAEVFRSTKALLCEARPIGAGQICKFSIREYSSKVPENQSALTIEVTTKDGWPDGILTPYVLIEGCTRDGNLYRKSGSTGYLMASEGRKIPRRQVVLPFLNILKVQDITSSARIDRNNFAVKLNTGTPGHEVSKDVDSPFIYTTSDISFANPYRPFIDSYKEIDISKIELLSDHSTTPTLKDRLTALLTRLLSDSTELNLNIQIGCNYCFSIHQDMPELSLPMFLLPHKNLIGPQSINDISTNLSMLIASWMNTNLAREDRGILRFNLMISSGMTETSMPLLKLHNLKLDISALTS